MHVHGVCALQSSSLFQNENVSRTSTSERYVADVRRPDRTPMKVLVKVVQFVGEIWKAYVQSRINDLRYDIIVDISFNIITNPFHFCTCSKIEEDHSHSEDLDGNELVTDSMEMAEEEYDVEEGCE